MSFVIHLASLLSFTFLGLLDNVILILCFQGGTSRRDRVEWRSGVGILGRGEGNWLKVSVTITVRRKPFPTEILTDKWAMAAVEMWSLHSACTRGRYSAQGDDLMSDHSIC